MKTYHCTNPEENPTPEWLKKKDKKQETPVTDDPVAMFKANPEAFFPDFVKPML